ncbi:MAG: dihydrodipicolinate synthase family protein [Planctomycetota bacterium]|nr:dihydrodipicolinate synthase family protein [Planctomycetota bacterium]
MRRHPEIQQALSSLIPSVRVAFHPDGAIDFPGTRNYVERCIENGAVALMLTYGDSLYSILTDAELADVTRAVVEQARGRAKVIAAERQWWTGKAVAWAKECREIGADILMVFPPDWAQSSTLDTLVKHYAAVAKEMPVMVVTALLFSRGQGFRLELINRLHDEVPNVIAIKDDVCDEFGRRMTAAVHDRWTVVAGGSKQIHLYLAPFGCQGHLSTLITYKPDIAHRYWKAVTSSDYDKAAEIVRDYDMPMFDALMGLPGSFDAGMHAWCELIGIQGRWRRSPYYNLTDKEMDALGAQLDKIGLLDKKHAKLAAAARASATKTGRGKK